jgi:hypothetical protein
MRGTWPAALGLLLALMLSTMGCENQPRANGAGNQGASPPGQEGEAWPFWPVKMQIHPLTRFLTDSTSRRLVLEARIEFLDGYGHNTKAVGQVRLDLYDLAAGEPSTGTPLINWNQDIRDLQLNHRYFDDVTRTYLFKLDVDPEKVPREPELRAYFLSADGRKMEATLRVRK